MFTVGIEQFPGTIPPFLIRRTAKGLFETLRRNLDDAEAALSRREFDHRLSLDRFQTRTKPTRRALQQGNDGTCALAVEKGDETLQQFGQIVPGADLKRNRSDGSDNELAARTLGLSDNECGLGGVYPENHAGIISEETSGVKRRVGQWLDSRNFLHAFKRWPSIAWMEMLGFNERSVRRRDETAVGQRWMLDVRRFYYDPLSSHNAGLWWTGDETKPAHRFQPQP